jgi:uncharacterized integral membrane protein
MWTMRSILFILLIFLVLGFTILNSGSYVDVNLHWRVFYHVPLVLALFSSFMLGVIFWFLVNAFQGLDLRKQNRQLKRKLANLREELSELRNADLQSEPPSDNLPAVDTPPEEIS